MRCYGSTATPPHRFAAFCLGLRGVLGFQAKLVAQDARAAAEVVLLAEERLKCTIEEITGKIKHLQLTFEF